MKVLFKQTGEIIHFHCITKKIFKLILEIMYNNAVTAFDDYERRPTSTEMAIIFDDSDNFKYGIMYDAYFSPFIGKKVNYIILNRDFEIIFRKHE